MEIIKERSGDALTLKLQGRLDTATAPELEMNSRAASTASRA